MPPIWLRSALSWSALVGLITAVLLPFRESLDKAHIALAYLLVVLLVTARTGRATGIVLAILSFVCFNFFLLPPYHTLRIADPRDWLVLFAFLITSLVAAQLFYRAQNEAAAARQRSEEIGRFATLGAETLSAGRAEDATQAIARVLQSTLEIGACDLFDAQLHNGGVRRVGHANRDDFELALDERLANMFDYALEHDAIIVRRMGGAIHVLTNTSRDSAFTQPDAAVVVMPLRVRGTGVGLLQLANDRPLQLNEPQRRFAQALTYYAALGVERVRLTAEAERVEALRVADRLKDALLAAVSHDLRTPLTTIKALAHEVGVGGDERAQTIEAEADRLNQVVTDLLDLSRLRAGALQLSPELNAADDLLAAAIDQISGLERASDVQVYLPEEIVVGYFDLLHSLRALVNLIDNALKYSPNGSPVEVRVAGTIDRISFAVLDRGPGIPHQDIERVFEPFVRGSGTAVPIRGAGLGLSIAQGLAVAQGGYVRYAPRPEGGACFTLYLPAAELPRRTP